MQYRRETREGPVDLLLRGGGKPLKLAAAKDSSAYPWPGSLNGGALMGDGLAGVNESMSGLAERLSRSLERPVLDRTGLPGSYDFRVAYSSPDPQPDLPAMIVACLHDLGLKLESAKRPVEKIGIEHAAKPSAN